MKPHLQTTVWTLLEAGASQREIQRVTGIDRKTIRGYHKRFAAAAAASSPGVATGSVGVATEALQQIPPPRPPVSAQASTLAPPLTAVAAASASACEPHRAFIEAQLRLRRNAMAIYQDRLKDFPRTVVRATGRPGHAPGAQAQGAPADAARDDPCRVIGCSYLDDLISAAQKRSVD